jgi:hypothetical protein
MALAGTVALVHGADPPKPSPPAPDNKGAAKVQVHIYSAKNARATELARLVKEVFGGEDSGRNIRTGVDETSNSVVIAAPEDDLIAIMRFLIKVDERPRPDSEAVQHLKIYPLKYAETDRFLEESLRMLFTNRPGKFTLDRARNQVVLFTDEYTQKLVETLLQRLDQPLDRGPEKPRPPAEMQVRIVWLASGLARKDAPNPPPDLHAVITELAKVGVEEPRLVSQSIINANTGSEFTTQGLAKLDTSCTLAINGMVLDKPGRNMELRISIKATPVVTTQGSGPFAGRGGPAAQICRLETTITAPLGHSVVLGVTPTETITSVFVVQMLPKKPAPPGARH